MDACEPSVEYVYKNEVAMRSIRKIELVPRQWRYVKADVDEGVCRCVDEMVLDPVQGQLEVIAFVQVSGQLRDNLK